MVSAQQLTLIINECITTLYVNAIYMTSTNSLTEQSDEAAQPEDILALY